MRSAWCLALLLLLSTRTLWSETPEKPPSELSTLDWIASTIDSASTWSGRDVQALLRSVVDIAADEMRRTAADAAEAAAAPWREELTRVAAEREALRAERDGWRVATLVSAVTMLGAAAALVLDLLLRR